MTINKAAVDALHSMRDAARVLSDLPSTNQQGTRTRAAWGDLNAKADALSAALSEKAEVAAFGTYVEYSDGATAFRKTGEPFSPTAQGGKYWTLYTNPTQQPEAQAEPVAWIPDDALEQLKPPMLRLLNVPLITYAAYGHSPIYLSPQPQAIGEPTADDENDECRAAGCIASECHAWGCRVERKPDAMKLLDQAEKCISAAVRIEQVYPDEPPMPVGEWDYGADQLAAEIREFLAAQQPAPQPVEPTNETLIRQMLEALQESWRTDKGDAAIAAATTRLEHSNEAAAPQPVDDRGAVEALREMVRTEMFLPDHPQRQAAYDKGRATLSAAPQAREWPPVVAEILAELERATRKFPTWPTDPLHALAVLGEEFGETTKAMLQLTYEPHKTSAAEVRTEAFQTAAMALRLAMSLDRYEYRPGEQHSQQGGA